MKNAAPIVFTNTPLREPWMYDELFAHDRSVHVDSPEDLKRLTWQSRAVIKIPLEDNPYITEAQRKEFEDSLDEDEKATRIHGEFASLQGRVYKGFDRTRHVLDQDLWFQMNPEWTKYTPFLVIDPHDRKPHAIGWGVVTPRNETVFIHEWPEFSHAKQRSWSWTTDDYATMIRNTERSLWKLNTEASAAFLEMPAESPVQLRIMDPNFGRAPKAGTGRSVADEFADRGLYFDTTVDDDIESGHIAVRQDLKDERLFFLSNCSNLIKAMESYTWDEYRGRTDRAPKEKPRDKYKDFADVVRYARMFPVTFTEPSLTKRWMYPPGYRNGGMHR